MDLSSATSSGKKLVTSGDITDFVTYTKTIPLIVTVPKEFDIEYMKYDCIARVTISAGAYSSSYNGSSSVFLGYVVMSRSVREGSSYVDEYFDCEIFCSTVFGSATVSEAGNSASITYLNQMKGNGVYRLYA